MTLLGMQTVLAQLYTDRVFREAFFADPMATCARSALTEVERHQLAALDRLQVERYTWSLQGKRLHLVRTLLPATANTLAEQFAPLFHTYCDTRPSAPERGVVSRPVAVAVLMRRAPTRWGRRFRPVRRRGTPRCRGSSP